MADRDADGGAKQPEERRARRRVVQQDDADHRDDDGDVPRRELVVCKQKKENVCRCELCTSRCYADAYVRELETSYKRQNSTQF